MQGPRAKQGGYRAYLIQELKRRKAAHPQYSMRAFAKFLGLDSGFLSRVLGGTKDLSPDRSEEIARKLGLSAEGVLAFRGQVEHELGNQAEPSITQTTIPLDQFEIIADWHHFAILGLVTCVDFRPQPAWISQRLGVPELSVIDALGRLIRLGYLEQLSDGGLRKPQTHVTTPSGTPSPALRHMHAQLMEKAKDALLTQPIDKRDITSLSGSIDPNLIPQAKEEIRRFRARMKELFVSSKTPTQVYQLNVQLFELTQNEEEGTCL